MRAKEIKKRLTIGFSVMLLLIAVLLVVGITSMRSIESRLNIILNQHNVKTELVTSMRNAARERTISLYRMLVLTSKLERKQEQLPFQLHLSAFNEARKRLALMRLSPVEQQVLATEAGISHKAISLQDQVANLLAQDQVVIATQLLYNETLPMQEQLTATLADLIGLQREASQQAGKEAASAFKHAMTLIMLLGALAIMIGCLVAYVVIRRTTQAEMRLFREKERAQVTLHSIGEGVITNNADGVVDYCNDVAQELTGWSRNDATGKLLSEVFTVIDEEGKPPEYDLVQRAIELKGVVNSSETMLLHRKDGLQYAIEYTVAPIRDYDDSIRGTVVVFRNVTEIRNMMQQMAYQATHDSLTNLINRREFERCLENALKSARDNKVNHVLCYMDLDQFKVINDSCGHIAGDEILKQLGYLLQKNVRRTDTLARLGGDEFGVLLNNCFLDKAVEIVEELRKAMVGYRFVWKDKSFEIGASFGIVEINDESGGITELLSAADTACFVAKDLGRNRAHIYQLDDKLLEQRRNEMAWLPRIREALEQQRFQLFQQRIIPLKKSDVAPHFYEILVRITDSNGEVMSPKAFVPAAERFDLMPAIDRWIIENAFDYIARHIRSNPDGIFMWTINLSGQSLCDDKFYEFVIGQYYRTHINSSFVCFEITETAAVSNLSSAHTLIDRLKEKGFLFALDDFGSGLSSFTYLKNLPVDFLKIDGSFVKDMARDPIDRAMVASINEIGHVMGLKTIAEYVEDGDALECLKEIGVDYAQGYWLHKPESLDVNDAE